MDHRCRPEAITKPSYNKQLNVMYEFIAPNITMLLRGCLTKKEQSKWIFLNKEVFKFLEVRCSTNEYAGCVVNITAITTRLKQTSDISHIPRTSQQDPLLIICSRYWQVYWDFPDEPHCSGRGKHVSTWLRGTPDLRLHHTCFNLTRKVMGSYTGANYNQWQSVMKYQQVLFKNSVCTFHVSMLARV